MQQASAELTQLEWDQVFLANYLQIVARSFYDDNNQPGPSITADLVYKNVAEGSVLPVKKEFASEVGEWLTGLGITAFAEYKRGGTARILAAKTISGKACVIRIPLRFDQSEEHQRINHPAVLQPLATLEYGRGQNIEILPFVPVTGLLESLRPVKVNGMIASTIHVLRSMYVLAGLDCSGGIKNDLGVLPDGTPVLIDPDIARFKEGNLSHDWLQGAARAVRNYPYMQPVLWIQNSRPAQDQFFGSDYLSTPLEAGDLRREDSNPQPRP